LEQRSFPISFAGPIAAQFIRNDLIALLDFEMTPKGVALGSEKHFRLVPPEQMTHEDLAAYRDRPLT